MGLPAEHHPPFLRRVLTVVGLASLAVVIGLVVWHAGVVLLLVFAGVLVGIAIEWPARRIMDHTPLTRPWATGLVLLVLVGVAAGVGFAAGPGIGRQFEELSERLPESAERLRAKARETSWGRAVLRGVPDSGELVPAPSDALSKVGGVFSAVTWAASAFIVVLFTGLFVAFEPGLYVSGALRLAPPGRRRRAREVLGSIGGALRWWIVGRLAIMAIDGVAIAGGLWLLGVPLAMVLGLLAAVLAFIPNLGPVLAFVPAGLLALTLGPMMVLYVALLYIGVQTVESYLFTPLIEKKTVSLPPALLLGVQVVMGVLAGVPGLLVSTPLLVVAVVTIQMLYIQDTLGERVAVLGEEPRGA